jgi:flagellar motor switch protein FliN/FliY
MEAESAPDAKEQIAIFSDIPLEIDVELDRKLMSVREILGLEEGSVFQLNRSAGENIGILIGEALVASGEIVILEENMGVRITDFNEDA